MRDGGAARSSGTRRLLVASIALGVFVLVDLGLLGWLIFRSLSKREIDRVLLETRVEAEQVADQLITATGDGEDLFTLIAVEHEKQTYIDNILQRSEIIQNVEIRNTEGHLVFRAIGEHFTPAQEYPDTIGLEPSEIPRQIATETVETSRETINYDMEIPIGDLGILHVGISQQELQARVEVLRGELTRQTSVLGAVTVVVLILAYLTMWWLWRRSRLLEEQAAEAERLAYIGTLASGLAHEIRNPLNSLNLNMQMLEEEAGGPKGPGRSRLFEVTQQEIGRLERLVTDFLSYARPRPLEMTEVPAVELLHQIRELLTGEFDARGARLRVEDLSHGGCVRVDSAQFSQLLMNLAQNALGATEETDRPPRVSLTARATETSIYLEVEDNGIGIPEDEQAKIFDLFYSTRKGGTGLGLAVVRRIVTDHGGSVEVESTVGVGTRVRVILPRVRKTEPELGAEPVAARSSA